MSNPWACWNCGHKISEVEIDCDINGRIAARFECDDFEPRKDNNDGWDAVQEIYKNCKTRKDFWEEQGVDYNLTSDEILGHIKAYEIVMDECEQKLQQAGI